MSLIDQLKEAREARCEAHVAYLHAKEDLRTAENLALTRRVEAGKLGNNAEVRRAQLDDDCAAERNNLLTTECEFIRTETALAIAVDSVSPYAAL